MADAYQIFNWYENGKIIEDYDIERLRNYLAAQLISWSPNTAYYQDWYDEVNNLQIVVRWRAQRNNGEGWGKKGERVCYKNTPGGQIIDLTKNKDHIEKTGCTCNTLDV